MSARRGHLARALRAHHALLIALFASGCPGVVRPLERPRVDVREVAAAGDANGDLRVRVSLRVVNSNSIALSARALDWELAIAGAEPRRGRAELDQTISALAGAIVKVAFVVPAGSAASNARDYRLSGTLHLTSERGDIGAVFDGQGEASDSI
jgi:hypothetical protein